MSWNKMKTYKHVSVDYMKSVGGEFSDLITEFYKEEVGGDRKWCMALRGRPQTLVLSNHHFDELKSVFGDGGPESAVDNPITVVLGAINGRDAVILERANGNVPMPQVSEDQSEIEAEVPF